MAAGLQRAFAAAAETRLTQAQADALKWLRAHNETGVFNKNGVLLAAGELAPFMRSTWNALAKAGLVDIWRPGTRGPKRVAVTAPALGRK
jgi:hypothetical protein